MKENILDVMRKISSHIREIRGIQGYAYVEQREMILSVFNNSMPYSTTSIMLRLTVIDSLYSTNASYAYFSIEDIAKAIYALGTEEDALNYFKQIARGKAVEKNLFEESYGIRKNTQVGGKLISLISKYAYYTLLSENKCPLGFPIYDSLAIEVFPVICEILKIPYVFKHKDNIQEYVACLNALRAKLFGEAIDQRFEDMQQFDILDAYLWRIGKLRHGNYSLLFTKSDYLQFIENVLGNLSGGNKTINEIIYNRFNTTYPDLCKIKINKTKNNSSYTTYEVDINKLIAEICDKKPTKDILSNVKDSQGAMYALIENWKAINKHSQNS